MDISKLDTRKACNIPTPLELLGPNGELLGVQVVLLGVDSDAYREAYRKQQDQIMRTMMRNRSGGLSGDDRDRFADELLCSCIVSWSGLEENGKDFPCNRENILRLLHHSGDIRKQIEETVNDRSFFGKS